MTQTHGDPGVPPPGPANNNTAVVTVAPEYDGAARLARRIRVHHLLVRRRRWSRELDELLAPEPDAVHCACCRASTGDGPVWTPGMDYRAAGLDLDLQQRDYRGRELAAAGWCP